MFSKSIKRLAIVPARGGSKRIQDKNIKLFSGHPIIKYILDSALNSKLFTKIHVSTDSKRIKEEVQNIGYEIDFMRPQELSDDFAPLIPVLQYVVEKYEELAMSFDEIWLLMACNPLITSSTLIRAAELYSSVYPASKPLIAIKEYPVPIEWAYKKEDQSNYIKPLYPNDLSKRSQDLTPYYHDAGAFEIYSPNLLKQPSYKLIKSNYLGFLLGKNESIDIDTLEDWELAESIYKYKYQNGFSSS